MQINDSTGAQGSSSGELIPARTLALANFHVRERGPSKNTGADQVNLELTLTSGPHAKRKVFTYMGNPDDMKATEIWRSMSSGNLVRMLEAVGVCQTGIMSSYAPYDTFDKCLAALTKAALDGKMIGICVTVEKGTGGHSDKNGCTYLSPNPKSGSAKGWNELQALLAGGGATGGARAGFTLGTPAAQPAPALAAPGWTGGAAPQQNVADSHLVDDEIPF